jgi:hypothetical protein
MSLGLGDSEPSAEEMQQIQEEMEMDREVRQQSQGLASQFASERGAAEPGYWDIIGNADIGDHDNLESYAAAELSSTHSLSNITREEYLSRTWRIETEFWLMNNEFRDGDSSMADDDMRIMYGDDRPVMTNERARRKRSASQVKKNMLSLGVDARGLRSGTEIHAVSKHERMGNDDEESSSGGIRGWLSG